MVTTRIIGFKYIITYSLRIRTSDVYKKQVFKFWMRPTCSICLECGPDLETECGHHYHKTCFLTQGRLLNLHCSVCSRSLGRVHVSPCGTLHVGIKTKEGLLQCYSVNHESKIDNCQKILPHWCRTITGRLVRRTMTRLKNSIFIT